MFTVLFLYYTQHRHGHFHSHGISNIRYLKRTGLMTDRVAQARFYYTFFVFHSSLLSDLLLALLRYERTVTAPLRDQERHRRDRLKARAVRSTEPPLRRIAGSISFYPLVLKPKDRWDERCIATAPWPDYRRFRCIIYMAHFSHGRRGVRGQIPARPSGDLP